MRFNATVRFTMLISRRDPTAICVLTVNISSHAVMYKCMPSLNKWNRHFLLGQIVVEWNPYITDTLGPALVSIIKIYRELNL